ncbi:MAG: hypothetical protein KZQ65_09365, partial [Candidatus Thiodiazotropha sp. (ex Gloverina cf. vestifex)]|nr:hypothetical protein [Candidatus Thiodiazotropha sp. (ex Gloverina cf. vestifex)]
CSSVRRKLFASWGLYNDWPRMCTIIPQSMDLFRTSLTVTITAIQPRLRLSGTNRLGFQPSMAISGRRAGSGSIGMMFNSWLHHIEHAGKKHR